MVQSKVKSMSKSKVKVTLRPTASQSTCPVPSPESESDVLVSSPLCGRLSIYCFLSKCLCLKYVILALWGALSDEKPGLPFVSHGLVICLCIHLQFTYLSTESAIIYVASARTAQKTLSSNNDSGTVVYLQKCCLAVAFVRFTCFMEVGKQRMYMTIFYNMKASVSSRLIVPLIKLS
jgi:hypothetical protein